VAKGPEAYRTISEAADIVGVGQHVLRFWETRFAFVRPMKTAGGRRFYRPRDLAMLAEIRRLLHDEGYTIKGVQKRHREQGLLSHEEAAAAPPTAPAEALQSDLEAMLGELLTVKARLEALLGPQPRGPSDESSGSRQDAES
jgi:DNA-binding transcriptional MerR regulator